MKQEDSQILVRASTNHGGIRALPSPHHSLIANMVEGVTNGFEKRLEIQGVGYRASLQGRKLVLALGYSHPVELEAPDGIDFEVPLPTRVVVRGICSRIMGEVAANIRKQRPPEPYKGKGIRYEGKYVARKVGASAHEPSDRPVEAAPSPSRARQGARHRRASAAVRIPLESRHPGAGDQADGRPRAWPPCTGPRTTSDR